LIRFLSRFRTKIMWVRNSIDALPFGMELIFGAVCFLIIIVPRSAARDEAIAYVRAANAARRV